MRIPTLELTHPYATRPRLMALAKAIPGAWIGIKIAAHCREAIKARLAAGVKMPVLMPPHGASVDSVKATIVTLAPKAF